MPWAKGQSGNTKGYPRGRPHRLTVAVKKMVERDGVKIIEDIIRDAKNNDAAARQLFMKYLWPRLRLVATPVDLPPGEDAAAIRKQISELVRLAAAGAFDLDALKLITDALRASIDSRVVELEEIVRDIVDQHEEDSHDNGRIYHGAG